MRDSGEPLGLWAALGTIAVLTVPSLVWFGVTFWELPLELLGQATLLAVGYVVSVLVAATAGGSRARRVLTGVVTLSAAFLVTYLFQDVRPDFDFSRGAGLVAWGLAASLITGGVVLPRGRLRNSALVVLTIPGILAGGALASDLQRPVEDSGVGATATLLRTAYYPLGIRYHDVAQPADRQGGGGLTRVEGRFLAVTGSGAFYAIERSDRPDAIESRRLAVPSPSNAGVFASLVSAEVRGEWFRVLDLTTRAAGNGYDLFASHHAWNEGEQCFYVAVSSIRIDTELEPVDRSWSPVFRAIPCLPVRTKDRGANFLGLESGGRLDWYDSRRLILTIGDHNFDGLNREIAAAQDDDYDYGKTLLIDAETGQATRFTLGHRNPQGLYIGRDGRVWSTEHGPMGGDELNLLEAGRNYGWPYATYGTDYGRFTWGDAKSHKTAAGFQSPVYAWLPSVGVSNLIEVEGDQFARWKGDLLVGSLRGRTLFRVGMDDGRVSHVEPLPVGRSIRDLTEGPEGDIWLWSDQGQVARLTTAETFSRGAEAFDACSTCHTLEYISGGRGPALLGIVGDKVASRSDFDYSSALRSVGGLWTEERLDAFLGNPEAFAPGSSMGYRVDAPEVRTAIINFLRDARAYGTE